MCVQFNRLRNLIKILLDCKSKIEIKESPETMKYIDCGVFGKLLFYFSGWFKGLAGWLVTLLSDSIEEKCALFRSRSFFVLIILNSNMMLNTNLSGQRLSAFTNIFDVPIAVFGYLRGSLYHIVSHSKGCVPYEGKCIVYCAIPSIYLPKRVCLFWKPFQHIMHFYLYSGA